MKEDSFSEFLRCVDVEDVEILCGLRMVVVKYEGVVDVERKAVTLVAGRVTPFYGIYNKIESCSFSGKVVLHHGS